ncbi:hypothetical protein QP938_12570 [Porticoccaceae bacterium LTM1]|nr:hypothetical protein QP938_12570 [Porticoccaceae bacterium LTM1]
MAQYLFIYHGGGAPEPEEMNQVMEAWGDWFANLGSSVVDGGNPVGISTTVTSDGTVLNHGGSNPATGYSMIEAQSLTDAITKAQKCPILAAGGSVELAEIIDTPLE